jgi:hypothetical protein
MKKVTIGTLLCAGALTLSPAPSHAVVGITDPVGDILTTFKGTNPPNDLDVLDATVLYDSSTNLYRLTATLDATPGSTTPAALYVWGVNTGAGTTDPGFVANNITGVRFNEVVLLQANGVGNIVNLGAGGVTTPLPGGSIAISGNTISAIVPGSLLAGTGFNPIDYTWNLWPRDVSFGTLADFGQIADFAPNNANFTTTAGTVVPEPEAYLGIIGGLLFAGWVARRRAVK